MNRTFYFFVISLCWVAGLENDRCLKLIRVIDATWSIYTWWMYHLPDVSVGNGSLVYKNPEIPFVSVTNVCTGGYLQCFRNDYLFDMTTFLPYFPIYHKPCCSSLHNKPRVFFNLLSPWPLWYMEVVLFCISNWPPVSSLPLIQNLCVAGVFSWVSDYPLLYLQYKLQTPSYNTWIFLNLASAALSSCMYCWGPQHWKEISL